MLKFVCEQCGYCDFSNKTTKCPACGGAYIKMSLIQSYNCLLYTSPSPRDS